MNILKNALTQLCNFPPRSQPEYKYQNHYNLILAVTQNLFENHLDDLINNFTDFEIRNHKSDSNDTWMKISEFNMQQMEFDIYTDTVRLGYITYILFPIISVHQIQGSGIFVIEVNIKFKNFHNFCNVSGIPLNEIIHRDVLWRDNDNNLLERLKKSLTEYGVELILDRNVGPLIEKSFTHSNEYCFILDVV